MPACRPAPSSCLRRRLLKAAWWAACFFALQAVAAESAPAWWRSLALRDIQGNVVRTPERWLVAVFLDPECPVANGYIPVLNALARDFSGRGFRVAGIYADPTLTAPRLQQHARDYRLAFETIDDREQRLARFTGASHAAEAVVLAASGDVLYRGRIDDRVGPEGVARPQATRHDLREVLNRLVAGERGPFPGEPGFGCSLAAPIH